jgi:hypothetical protein
MLAAQAANPPAKPTDRETSGRRLLAALAGGWSCSGLFADGRPLPYGDRLTCARGAVATAEATESRSELVPGRVQTAGSSSGSLDDLQFLQGKWIGEGTNEAGQAAGHFTFERDLLGKTCSGAITLNTRKRANRRSSMRT